MNKMFSVALLSLSIVVGHAVPAMAASISSPAVAAGTAMIKPGAYLRSADGRRIGVIDGVDTASNGAPLGAQVIIDARIVHIPVSTISGTDKDHFTTSLSYKAVNAL